MTPNAISSADTDGRERLEDAVRGLRAWVEARDFAGHDAYDALRSPFLKLVSLGMKWPRIAVIQTMKRSPINLRPLLGVRPGHNPKGLGLFLGSYARIHARSADPEVRRHAERLFELLTRCVTVTTNGHGWGYNFDWQSRAFYVPRGTPTIVNTAFIGHALIDAWKAFGEDRFLDLALPARGFILHDLARTVDGDAFCFSYTPIDRLIVHNANLLGASLLIRLHHVDPHPESRDVALASLAWSMRRQREDGSWWYADTDYQKWIDSFHTGFNLQSIRWFLDLGEAEEHRQGYERGVRFYADNFFLPDGRAKYFHDRLEPEDVHSYAQALAFFSGEGERYAPLVRRVADRMIDTFRMPEGWFAFQKRKGRPIRIPYIRWGQAWALYGLTSCLSPIGAFDPKGNMHADSRYS